MTVPQPKGWEPRGGDPASATSPASQVSASPAATGTQGGRHHCSWDTCQDPAASPTGMVSEGPSGAPGRCSHEVQGPSREVSTRFLVGNGPSSCLQLRKPRAQWRAGCPGVGADAPPRAGVGRGLPCQRSFLSSQPVAQRRHLCSPHAAASPLPATLPPTAPGRHTGCAHSTHLHQGRGCRLCLGTAARLALLPAAIRARQLLRVLVLAPGGGPRG